MNVSILVHYQLQISFPVCSPAASPTAQPTLRELVQLRVMRWYELGLLLDIDEGSLDIIEHDHHCDLKACRRKIFSLWLRNSKNATFEALLEALLGADEIKAAEELCQQHGE